MTKKQKYIYDLMNDAYFAERTFYNYETIGDVELAELFFFYTCILQYEQYLLTVTKH